MDQAELIALIEKAAREGSTDLDLSREGITQLPEQIGQLVNLESLDLEGNHLEQLPQSIGKLKQLTHLFLGSLEESVG